MFAMNPPPTVGLKTLIIFGLSFVKQLAHGLVKRFAGYVTLLNAFVLDASLISLISFTSSTSAIPLTVGESL